jgi:hypothetical protein
MKGGVGRPNLWIIRDGGQEEKSLLPRSLVVQSM